MEEWNACALELGRDAMLGVMQQRSAKRIFWLLAPVASTSIVAPPKGVSPPLGGGAIATLVFDFMR